MRHAPRRRQGCRILWRWSPWTPLRWTRLRPWRVQTERAVHDVQVDDVRVVVDQADVLFQVQEIGCEDGWCKKSHST